MVSIEELLIVMTDLITIVGIGALIPSKSKIGAPLTRT